MGVVGNYVCCLVIVVRITRLGWAKRWGKVLKSSYVGQTTKGVPIFMGGVDPSRHHGLVYGSRLIANQANSLLYKLLILHVRICKVLFKNWRFQIKIVGCIISVQACKCICQWNTHSILLCNLTQTHLLIFLKISKFELFNCHQTTIQQKLSLYS